jgi:hypothetical protein
MDGEQRRVAELRVHHAPEVGIDLADAVVRARRRHSVAAGRSRSVADEVVALVNGEHEKRVWMLPAVP